MRVREPNFDTGAEMMAWRRKYINNWLKEQHPALVCTYRKTQYGGEDVWIFLNSYLSSDEVFAGIQMPEYMLDSKAVIGKATTMKGVHAFTAPVMCERIEKRIKQTGDYDALCFLDSIAKRSGKNY